MDHRIITNTGSRKVIGRFPSWKLGQMVMFESKLERDYLYLLDYDPAVVAIRGQWPRIRYVLDGKFRTYWPDFRVERLNKRQIIEVKPAKKARKEDNVRRFQAIRQVCLDKGYEFALVTEETIRLEPRLKNIKLLWRYSRIEIWPRHQLACYEFFGSRADANLQELLDHFAKMHFGREVIYSMMFHGALSFDLTQEINRNTRLWVDVATAARRAS
jgi:hypothetical protein